MDWHHNGELYEAVVQRLHQGGGGMGPEAAGIRVAARRIDHDEMTGGESVEGVLQAPRLVGFGRCGLRRGGALDGAVLGLLERPAPVFALDLFALGGAVAPEGGEDRKSVV